MARSVDVFLNRRSGGAAGLEDRITAGFHAAGLPCRIVPIEPGMDVPARTRAAAARPDAVVIAAGGDGTVNAVASGIAGTGSAMGVLPLGTLNHFAKDLGLPMDLNRAIHAIAQPHPIPVDVGEVNGHVFVNNSSVGIYTQLVTQRESLQKRGFSKWLALVLTSLRAFGRFRQITVHVCVNGRTVTHRTPILFVGNNEYQVEGPRIGSRDRLDGGLLSVYLTPGLTRRGVLRIAVAALFGKVREVPNYMHFTASEFSVDLRRRVCRVSLDGEVRRIRGPLRYQIRPAALHVCTSPPE